MTKLPAIINPDIKSYDMMCVAITKCHDVDECKEFVNRGVAAAAYCKVINDEETRQKFIRIQMRAWRQLSVLFGGAVTDLKPERYPNRHGVVDVSLSRKTKTVREVFKNVQSVMEMTDSRIAMVFRLGKISEQDFEETLTKTLSGGLDNFLGSTPEAHREWERSNAARSAFNPEFEEEVRKQFGPSAHETDITEEVEEAQREEAEEELAQELLESAKVAMREVGVTFDRRDRKKMVITQFLHNEDVHDLIRLIAYQEDITHHEAIRRGLKMYAEHLGHKWPASDVPPKTKKTATTKDANKGATA